MRGEGYSLADIRAVTEGNNGGFGGFGEGGAWWLLIIIILFGGWNRNGFGGYGNGGSGADANYVLTSDFSQLSRQLSDSTAMTERKLDSITNGLCTLGYDNLVQSNGINANINTLSTNLQGCCCDIKGQIAENRYQNSQNINALNNSMNAGFTSLQQAMCINTRDILENQNNGTRAILDAITTNRIEDLKEAKRQLEARNASLELSASQSAQNEYLLNSLRNGCPVNAQLVCGNQPIPVQYITAGCGCNSGCGCNM